MAKKSTRREFLKQAIVGGVALGGGLAGLPLPSMAASDAKNISGKSRVVEVTHPAVIAADGSIAGRTPQEMLEKAMVKLANTGKPSFAWSKYFKPSDVVGLKINCLFGQGASTHPEVVDAIVAGLISASVKAENIIVWDRSTHDLEKCGYVVNKNGKGPRYIANDKEWGEEVESGSFKGRVTKILAEDITALINVPILKHHEICGVTCALKNHYGSIEKPGLFHDMAGSSYLADINSVADIRNKTRLVVVDAIRPLADGGPGLRNAETLWDYKSIVVTTDPVAADYVGWQILEERRKEMSLKPLNQPAKWLAEAAERGLGNSDPGKIEIIRV